MLRPDERPGGSCFTDQKSSATSSVLVAPSHLEGLMTMTDARLLGADEATFIAAVRSGDGAVRAHHGAPPA
jgi:hypothetical protein